MSVRYYTLREGEQTPDEFCAVRFEHGRKIEHTHYVRKPPTCTIEPANRYDEDYGLYTCSNCGELWQLPYGGPRENGWSCCPRCRAIIDYGEVDE